MILRMSCGSPFRLLSSIEGNPSGAVKICELIGILVVRELSNAHALNIDMMHHEQLISAS
jgi:hypothetical protein